MANHFKREPIAIVGIGCRFPGGLTSKESLWRILCDGVDVVTDVPPDRLDATYFHASDVRKYGVIKNRKGGFLDDIYGFDAAFFDLFPEETSRMDPQQRLALEAAAHAIEDSGTPLQNVVEAVVQHSTDRLDPFQVMEMLVRSPQRYELSSPRLLELR